MTGVRSQWRQSPECFNQMCTLCLQELMAKDSTHSCHQCAESQFNQNKYCNIQSFNIVTILTVKLFFFFSPDSNSVYRIYVPASVYIIRFIHLLNRSSADSCTSRAWEAVKMCMCVRKMCPIYGNWINTFSILGYVRHCCSCKKPTT